MKMRFTTVFGLLPRCGSTSNAWYGIMPPDGVLNTAVYTYINYRNSGPGDIGAAVREALEVLAEKRNIGAVVLLPRPGMQKLLSPSLHMLPQLTKTTSSHGGLREATNARQARYSVQAPTSARPHVRSRRSRSLR